MSPADTKHRLRDAAVDIIATDGMRGLSVRRLCSVVGIRESTFYAHFTSKAELVHHLLKETGALDPLTIVTELAAADLSLHAYVEALYARLTDLWTAAETRRLRPLLESEAATSPAIRETFNDNVLAMIDGVGQTLARHHAALVVGPTESWRALAWSLVAPLAALRATLWAYSASDAHFAEGRRLAAAHRDTWLAVHARAM